MTKLLQISKVKVHKESGNSKIKRAEIEGFPGAIRIGPEAALDQHGDPEKDRDDDPESGRGALHDEMRLEYEPVATDERIGCHGPAHPSFAKVMPTSAYPMPSRTAIRTHDRRDDWAMGVPNGSALAAARRPAAPRPCGCSSVHSSFWHGRAGSCKPCQRARTLSGPCRAKAVPGRTAMPGQATTHRMPPDDLAHRLQSAPTPSHQGTCELPLAAKVGRTPDRARHIVGRARSGSCMR